MFTNFQCIDRSKMVRTIKKVVYLTCKQGHSYTRTNNNMFCDTFIVLVIEAGPIGIRLQTPEERNSGNEAETMWPWSVGVGLQTPTPIGSKTHEDTVLLKEC